MPSHNRCVVDPAGSAGMLGAARRAGEAVSCCSPGTECASRWDAFVDSCPRGQFQQSTAWATVKAIEGWSATREYLEAEAPASGGFQLLWRRSRFGRIGYVSKGPVLPEETPTAVDSGLTCVKRTAQRLRLTALVLQPPDDSCISSSTLTRHGFFPLPLASVISATGIIQLEGGAEGTLGRMSRTARQDWRTAARKGVTLTQGSRNDLSEFFALMCASATRQHERPNPAVVGVLEALWDAFPGRVGLTFAEHGGRRLAGLVSIRHRDRLILWKKGWSAEEPHLFANMFVMTGVLMSAASEGLCSADVVSMSLGGVAAVLAGHDESKATIRGRDMFNLRCGARPKLLPPAHLLVVNPAFRASAYRLLRWRGLRTALERRMR
jgi:hypothetical protein